MKTLEIDSNISGETAGVCGSIHTAAVAIIRQYIWNDQTAAKQRFFEKIQILAHTFIAFPCSRRFHDGKWLEASARSLSSTIDLQREKK